MIDDRRQESVILSMVADARFAAGNVLGNVQVPAWILLAWRHSRLGERSQSLWVAAVLAILLLPLLAPSHASTRPEFARLGKLVVTVRVYRNDKVVARGVGVVVGRAGHVLTSAAVLDAGPRATVVAQAPGELATKILLQEDESGLGVLQVKGLQRTGLSVFMGATKPQSLVFAAIPGSRAGSAGFIRGTVVKVLTRSIGDARIRFVQHSAIITPRAYGSPLLDECGRLVALNVPDPGASTFFITRRKLKPKGSVFALSVKEITTRLGRLGIQFSQATRACVSTEEQAQKEAQQAQKEAQQAQRRTAAAAASAAEEQRRAARLRRLAVWGGSAGAALLLMTLFWWAVSARRKQRAVRLAQAQAAVAAQKAAEALQRIDDLPEPAPFDCVFTGTGDGGEPYALNLQRYALGNPAGVVIGRNPADSAFIIADPSVSREHVRLYVEDGVLHIQDLGSTNGTHVNGHRLEPEQGTPLDAGDEVSLGAVTFRVDLMS